MVDGNYSGFRLNQPSAVVGGAGAPFLLLEGSIQLQQHVIMLNLAGKNDKVLAV